MWVVSPPSRPGLRFGLCVSRALCRGLMGLAVGASVGGCSPALSLSAAPPARQGEFATEQAILVGKGHPSYRLTVEVARTDQQRKVGLMFRRHLEDGRGMLFDFLPPRKVRMWMKNTLIPLDMLFLDASGVVVDMVQNAKPNDLTLLGPDRKVAAVLELPGGQVARWGLHKGDRLDHALFERPLKDLRSEDALTGRTRTR